MPSPGWDLEGLGLNRAKALLLSAPSCRKDKQFTDYFPNNYLTTVVFWGAFAEDSLGIGIQPT